MDEISAYNRERWEELAQANVLYSRPLLALDERTAWAWLEGEGLPPGGLGDLAGKSVLCLAGGGGQQSAVFSLLGAQVTVLDLSETQLARDRQAAAHYGYAVRLEQGDMRDLSRFADDSFDLVWHPYSINFVPQAPPVLAGVARLMRPVGLYRLNFANPFYLGITEKDWRGSGYAVQRPYQAGEVSFEDPCWDIYYPDDSQHRVIAPREFRHTLSDVLNTMAELGFVLLCLWELPADGDPSAPPGTWEHYVAHCPPWLGCWFVYQPGTARRGW